MPTTEEPRKAIMLVCKHCGTADNLIMSNGRPSQVCRPCRRGQIKRARHARGETQAAPADPVRRPRALARAGPMTAEERAAAIGRAHAMAQAEGISLVVALTIEGVLHPKRRY